MLKQSTGWFSAGWAFAEAMAILSDAAIKLFTWLYLNADCYTGRISITVAEIAQDLGKSPSQIQAAGGRTGGTWRVLPLHAYGARSRGSLLALRKTGVRIGAAGLCGAGS